MKNKCGHFERKECDCLNGVCFSFKKVPQVKPKVVDAESRLREIAPLIMGWIETENK